MTNSNDNAVVSLAPHHFRLIVQIVLFRGLYFISMIYDCNRVVIYKYCSHHSFSLSPMYHTFILILYSYQTYPYNELPTGTADY